MGSLTYAALRPTLLVVNDDEHIEKYLNHITRRRLSPATIRVRRDVLTSIDRDLPHSLLDASTPEIIPAIERAAADGHHGFATLVRLAVLTGQRRGALLALRWSDVDLAAGRLAVTRAVSRVQGVTHLKDTKTHARGIVSIDERTVAALRRWREISEAEDAVLGVELVDPFVWHEPDGGPWNPDRVTKRWRELADSVGLTGVRFNDLRHASATTMVAAGVDPRTAATRLQHSPEMLLATYAHHVPEKDRAAAELLAEALDGGG